ncbi:hypothetical protein B0H14DRAFT_842462 [Mycena olivaceomarginata]|nr:hypothetical protein B0H14DRAFT_842462 [Mycena olivaceomarginata]
MTAHLCVFLTTGLAGVDWDSGRTLHVACNLRLRCCYLNGRSRHPGVFSHKKEGPSPSFNLIGALPVYSGVLSRISLDTDQLPKSGCPDTYQCRPRRTASAFCRTDCDYSYGNLQDAPLLSENNHSLQSLDHILKTTS